MFTLITQPLQNHWVTIWCHGLGIYSEQCSENLIKCVISAFAENYWECYPFYCSVAFYKVPNEKLPLEFSFFFCRETSLFLQFTHSLRKARKLRPALACHCWDYVSVVVGYLLSFAVCKLDVFPSIKHITSMSLLQVILNPSQPLLLGRRQPIY